MNCRGKGKLTFWGGGINSQHVLPTATPEQVAQDVKEIVAYMKQDGGFVFNNVHNITAEVSPENIIAMYSAARQV